MNRGRCLVTGSEGYIGQALIKSLVESGLFTSVIGIDKVETAEIVADITSPIDLGDRLDGQFDSCVHLAAVAKEPGYELAEYYDVNHRGTLNVLDLCDQLGVSTVIFTSTMMVFPAGENRYDEACQVAPDTSYGGSKALAERDVLAWGARQSNRRVVVLRPGVVFGLNDTGNFDRMRRALAAGRFAYIGRRDTIKSCVHVLDVVGFIQAALLRPDINGIYHIAFPQSPRIDEIVAATQLSLGIQRWVPQVPYRVAIFITGLCNFLGLFRPYDLHPRRIQKLNRSTNIFADRWTRSGYHMRFPTLGEACAAWGRESSL